MKAQSVTPWGVAWNEIETVFLDMDGTLLDLAFDNYFWLEHVPSHYGRQRSIDFEQAKKLLKQKYDSKRGTLQWYCTDYWSETLNLDIADLKREISHRVEVFPGVPEFLQGLRHAQKRVVLLTNAHMDSVSIKFETSGLGIYMDRVISSHELGYAKEEAAFWPALVEHEPHSLDATLLIDDNLHVLDAAKRHGLKHLLSVKKPDTTLPAQSTREYDAIGDFAEIMP